MHFPLKSSPHHQLARNLFHAVAFCLPTNFPSTHLPGTWPWMLVCQQWVRAWTSTEKRQGETQAGISAWLNRPICFSCFTWLTVHRSQESSTIVGLRRILICFAPLGWQKAFWVCQQIFLYFCSLALDRAESEWHPSSSAEAEIHGQGWQLQRLHTLAVTSREVSIAQSSGRLCTQTHGVCDAAITLWIVFRLMRLKLQP